ncbi:MAG: hypothetical protein A7315_12425 [Candidatus Altiarchaeales archaeon WOR_SM1_79]|nr:MAG: hypothetical protein A7315_12425 [Candidatus Altiarchaeales archaeon WOR_SM1_79]
MAAVIETKNLTKRYGNFHAVKDLNLKIGEGEIFGFLGPNGAGKTTTIGMLIGILYPTKGSVHLFGRNLNDDYFNLKKKIGVVSEQQYMYNNMTAYEYLSFFADLYAVKNKKERIDELLKFVELYEFRNKRLKEYSKGMRQKISISRALVHDPDILFLDEPAYGLDPVGVKEVRDIIFHQKDKGKTIFMSSHILSEVEKICDEVGIINKGILVERGSMKQLKGFSSGIHELDIEVDKINDGIITTLKKFNFIEDIEVDGGNKNILKIKTIDGDHRVEISRCIFKNNGTIIGMSEKKTSLEDAFVEITRGGVKNE